METSKFLDAIFIYHSACKKQYNSNLASQNFYEKYDIEYFINSNDLFGKRAFKALTSHLKRYNAEFSLDFYNTSSSKYINNDFKTAIGFFERIPDFSSATVYYRDFEHYSRWGKKSKAINSLLNSIKAYHNRMIEIQMKSQKSQWGQKTPTVAPLVKCRR